MLDWDDLSPDEQVALAYCAPKGIPLTVFMGRVVGVGGQQWTDRDTQAAILWEIRQRSFCAGCGFPRSETMVPEDQARDYEVVAERCWACKARERKMADFSDDNGDPQGLYLSVRPA